MRHRGDLDDVRSGRGTARDGSEALEETSHQEHAKVLGKADEKDTEDKDEVAEPHGASTTEKVGHHKVEKERAHATWRRWSGHARP